MKDRMKPFDIILQILADTDLNQSVFLEKTGVSSSTFSDIKCGKVKGISQTLAKKIVAAFPQFSMSWLMTGEGDMYASGNSAPVFQNSGDNVTNHQQGGDVSSVTAQFIDLLKSKDEQMNRLIGVIERLSGVGGNS